VVDGKCVQLPSGGKVPKPSNVHEVAIGALVVAVEIARERDVGVPLGEVDDPGVDPFFGVDHPDVGSTEFFCITRVLRREKIDGVKGDLIGLIIKSKRPTNPIPPHAGRHR